MEPDEFYFGALLQAHGISARCSKDKNMRDEVVVLAAGSVYNYTDEELCLLFANNHVILEGKAATLLIERGLGCLFGGESYQVYASENDIQAYEQIEGDILVNGIPGYRASAFSRTGDYVAIQYSKKPCVKSRVYDYRQEEIGYGSVVSKGHLIVPYVVDQLYLDQLHPLRGKIVCDYLERYGKNIVRTNYANVYAYFAKGDKNILILVNTTLNTLPVTKFKLLGEQVTKLYEVDRDGVTREKSFSVDEEGFVTVPEDFKYITTKTFII